METLKLSPEILEWAAGQVGSTLGEVARKISTKSAPTIERGELTTAQALKFSKVAGIPFGFLFLDSPPEPRKQPLADFRTLISPSPLSKDFYSTFDDIEYKQTWYRDYLQGEHCPPLTFVGRFSNSGANAVVIAADMRKTLGITDEEIRAEKNSESLFTLISKRAEAKGVLIFRNAIVGNNTRRVLSVQEFRGFVISDAYAPAIFINGSDAPAATVFTLAHELAHIWIGESGISDTSPVSEHKHEKFCNEIAAEFLIPSTNFLELWARASGDEFSRIDFVLSQIKVSKYVVARRALELRLISNKVHAAIYKSTVDIAKKKKSDSSGGDFYANLPIRNSRKFTGFVTSMAMKGKISFREAGNLLNTNPNNVMTFYGKQ